MPRGLSDEAKRLWRMVAGPLAELGILTEIDVPAAMMMAEHYSIAKRAADRVAVDGLTADDENGAERKHPLLQVMRDNSAAFRQYAAEFGMTPSSRTRLHTEQPEQLTLLDVLFGADVQVGQDVVDSEIEE